MLGISGCFCFVLKDLFLMCIGVLPASMSVHYNHFLHLRSSEEIERFPGTGIVDGSEPPCGTRNPTRVL